MYPAWLEFVVINLSMWAGVGVCRAWDTVAGWLGYDIEPVEADETWKTFYERGGW